MPRDFIYIFPSINHVNGYFVGVKRVLVSQQVQALRAADMPRRRVWDLSAPSLVKRILAN